MSQPATYHQILILRPGAIGDTLLTFPALLALRRRFPAAEISVVGNAAPLRLAAKAGLIDQYDAFGAAWMSDLFGDEPTPALRARLERFDLGIVWMHAADTAADLARRLERAGVTRALPLVAFPPAGSTLHLSDHLVTTLGPLGVEGVRPEVRLAQLFPLAQGLGPPSSMEGPIPAPIILHPGAGGRHKRWAPERFAALADRFAALGYEVAITCGPADEEAVGALRAATCRARPRILAGLDLAELAEILRQARLFVGNDSGITHLAALLDVPTVAIFGPFDPAHWAPLGRHVAVVDAGRGCPHRGDPREGCRACNVLSDLDLETVWGATQSLLEVVSCPVHLG